MTPGRRPIAVMIAAAAVVAVAAPLGLRALRGPEVPVVEALRREVVQTVVSSGRVLPPTEVTLSAFLASDVTEVSAAEGDRVKPGQILARLDDREFVAAVSRARAAVARASAGAVEIRRQSLPAARERLRQAETNLDQARRAHLRDQELFGRGAIAPVELEQSRAALDVADSQRAAAALQLEAAGASGSAALVAAASLAQARAELASAEIALDRSRIRSPIDGVMTSRMVEPGDSVQPGARLFVISGVGRTRLVIEPDERNLALLGPGQAAWASAEAFPKDRFAATVGYIAPTVDARRGTVEVRLDVEAPPPYLRPDMTVSVEVEVARKVGVLVLPVAAVHEVSGDHPWVLSLEGGRALRRDVTLGLVGDGDVEVESGLTEGELVVASSATALAPGARARAKER